MMTPLRYWIDKLEELLLYQQTQDQVIVDNNLSVYEIMENESLFHDTTRQRSGVE